MEVRFEAGSGQWRFLAGGVEVGRSAAGQITQAGIVGLRLGSRPGRSARETAARKASGAATEHRP